MAFMEIHFFSEVLGRGVSVNGIIPEDFRPEGPVPYKTLYLLHGLSDDHTAWQRYTEIECLANRGRFAVIMPNADRSFYTNMAKGDRYLDYIALELPQAMRSFFKGMSHKPEDNFIAGLSMGGYGAFKVALNYPDRFAAACSLSGALDIDFMYRVYHGKSPSDIARTKALYENIFGEPEKLSGSEHDLLFLLEQNVKKGVVLPELYLTCGTEDPILPCSDSFFEKAKTLGVEKISYKQAPGHHNWTFWNGQIKDFAVRIAKGKDPE